MSNETNAVMTNDDEHWDLVLQPKNKLLDLKIRELIRYRDLVLLFIKRDFATAYKQTILGPLWYVVQPLITTVMYTFIFGNLAGIGSDGIPTLLFYYTGTSLWTYFTGCLNSASGVFTSNSGIFGKVYFPRLTVPISTTVGNMIKLGIQFAMLMIFYIYYLIIKAPIQPSWWALGLPLIVIWIGAMGTGLGMIISSLTTKYRDLNQLLSFGLSLAMYATPVAYPLSEPATGYGYIKMGKPLETVTTKAQEVTFKIEQFKEKPDLITAKKYIETGSYAWNSGMFGFRTKIFLSELEKCDPSVFNAFKIFSTARNIPTFVKKNGINLLESLEGIEQAYEESPKESIDKAIAEKTKNSCAVTASFSWEDVGSWDSFEKLFTDHSGETASVEAENCFVYSDIPVALCGVNDLVVVIKNNKALVMKKGYSDKVKEAVHIFENEKEQEEKTCKD